MAAFDTQFQSVSVTNFTAFRRLRLEFSSGLNVLIGPNATGKTHLMKLLYASAAVSKADADFADKLVGVFVPHQRRIGRLVSRSTACLSRSRVAPTYARMTATHTRSSAAAGSRTWMYGSRRPIACSSSK